MHRRHRRVLFSALAACCLFAASANSQDLEKELVIVSTGGTMEANLKNYFYKPFGQATGVDVISVATEMPDQWARTQAMLQSGSMEYDIVLATLPDLEQHKDMLQPIDCSMLPNVKANGIAGACRDNAVIRTIGGMLLAFNTKTYDGEQKPKNWADFWNLEKFPGPRGLPDTGNREWWVPAAALLADGVEPSKLFPLDLDRAYKKLDKIRPAIAVWWKSADQLQQALRTGEISMALSFSGRANQLIDQGEPIEISWDQAIQDIGFMAIVKNAAHPKAALAYMDYFYTKPQTHLAFVEKGYYDTGYNVSGQEIPAARKARLASAPENFSRMVVPDSNWLGAHRAELLERWTSWLNQ